MIKTDATPGKTQLLSGEEEMERKRAESRYQRNLFISMALNMSWQMAIVVIVPIVGGFKLDEAAHTTPALTILGFVIAMAGMFVVMRRAVSQADQALDKRRQQR